MSAPAANQAFEEAVKVTPISSHRYSALLRDDWCIGTVPNGGYSTAVLYRLALTHFAHTHPTLYNEPATPISMQLAFLRRTAAGPAILTVQDNKLGARTSTIHVALLQPSEKKKSKKTGSSSSEDEDLEVKIAGYITVSPAKAEVGVSFPTKWNISPPAITGSGPGGSVNFAALGETGRDGKWARLEIPFPNFRRAARQIELFGIDPALGKSSVVDQWSRFRPGGNTDARWTDNAVAFLVDMFPMALDGFDAKSKAATGQGEAKKEGKAQFWYPTVTLNIDFKKRLPAGGVEWLYSRVQTKVVRDGRTDLDVTVLDENGEVVALSTQVGLIVSASRNIGSRKSKM